MIYYADFCPYDGDDSGEGACVVPKPKFVLPE